MQAAGPVQWLAGQARQAYGIWYGGTTVTEVPEREAAGAAAPAEQLQQPAQEGTPQAEAPAAGTSELEALRTELERERARLQECLERWTRAQADLANLRRRTQAELENMQRYATAELITELLPVLDSFDRAFAALPAELRHFTWIEGVWHINVLLRAVLQRRGLEQIDALGKPFDPFQHEAVLREEGPAGEEVVVSVLQPGYKLHERVLRPALVKVGPRPQPAPERAEQPRPAATETAAQTPAPEQQPAPADE